MKNGCWHLLVIFSICHPLNGFGTTDTVKFTLFCKDVLSGIGNQSVDPRVVEALKAQFLASEQKPRITIEGYIKYLKSPTKSNRGFK